MSDSELQELLDGMKVSRDLPYSKGNSKTSKFEPSTVLDDLTGGKKRSTKSNLGFAAALLTVFICTGVGWYLWVRESLTVPSIFIYGLSNAFCCALVGMRIWESDWDSKTTPEYEQTKEMVQLISIAAINFLVTDLVFDINIIGSLLAAPDLLAAIVYQFTIIFMITLLNAGVYLYAINQRRVVTVAKRIERGIPLTKETRKRNLSKAELLARNTAIVILLTVSVFVIYMWAEYLRIMADFAARPLSERESFSKIFWYGLYGNEDEAWIFPPMTQAQYGGGDAFGGLFEMVFFNQVSAMLMFLMFLGTFTSIFVVNMVKAKGLQNIATIVAVGLPMLVIISVMIGLVDPPSIFVDIMNNRAIASFMFTFVEMCVYIIYMAIFFTFNNIAEIFQPGDDIDPQ